MNIYLTGYRCTGKTSLGKKLAESMGIHFIDADVYLTDKYNTTISDMVSSHGWDYFREKEGTILKEISSLENHVIATGGGVILRKENVTLMKETGIVIWLRATPETIKKRIVQDETTEDSRPSLTSRGLLDEIEETLNQRSPIYEESMNFAIDTDSMAISTLHSMIVKQLKDRNLPCLEATLEKHLK